MRVILINKTTFEIIQATNVTSIAYNSSTKNYTITGTGGGTFSAETYNLQVLW